jgi:hypothetical protein
MEKFSPDSKVWVYQSNRELSPSESSEISGLAMAFVKEWTAHGSQLKAAANILYNRFLVLTVDETASQASGCSIDKSLAFVQQIEKQFGIQLLDRMNIAYKQEGKVLSTPLPDFKKLLAKHKLNKDSVVFNNLITTKAEFDSNWETTVEKSWHARLLVSS